MKALIKILFELILAWEKTGFCNTNAGFPAKWCPKNEHRNSTLTMCHYPHLGSSSDWTRHKFSTNQKHWVVMCDLIGSSHPHSLDITLQGNRCWFLRLIDSSKLNFPMVTNINFLLTISIYCQEIRLWEVINWSAKRNTLLFYQILSTHSWRKCIEISLENSYVDIAA